MTTKSGSQRSNEKLAWFFTDPASRYELAEIVRLTRCSRDDIQNWVRRGMIEPDETTPGRRIYLPATVATILVAAFLRRRGVSANFAFMHAHVITKVALDWFAGGERDQDEKPKFEKDFRQHYAAYYVSESRAEAKPSSTVELLPGVLNVHILHRSELDQCFEAPDVGIIRLHWLWLHLAETAKHLKDRPSRRLSQEGAS
jgi:hypothetical protein